MATGSTKTTKARQARMIAALLDPNNKTQADACAAAGVPVRTLQNWLDDDPEFAKSLRAAEKDAIGEAARSLVCGAGAAVRTIANVMEDEKASPGIRLRAAGQLLTSLVQMRELYSIEQRLAYLESEFFRELDDMSRD